jgi:antiviral helicase SKI2
LCLLFTFTLSCFSYKDAGEALRRKQDKEREAAGLPPVQRVGARGAAIAGQRGQRGGQRGQPARGRGSTGQGRGGHTRTIQSGVDRNLYVHLLGYLRKASLLPAVVFTLSKKRCEENASTLTNADLCTSVEKSEIHVAIEKALSRLRGTASILWFSSLSNLQLSQAQIDGFRRSVE